jgi:hypothetical protein
MQRLVVKSRLFQNETLWSISSTLYAPIFCTKVIFAAFFLRMYVPMYVKKAAETTFERNIRTFNVDEIDTCMVPTKIHKNVNRLNKYARSHFRG